MRKKVIGTAHKNLYSDIIGVRPHHASASEIRNFAATEWDAYFKFCFVRNPFDRAVSDYKWRTRRKPGVSFIEFLRRIDDPQRPDPERVVPRPATNWPIYTIDDRVAVDFVGKFENLLEDFAEICDKIQIPFDPHLFPLAKQGLRREHYRTYYGQEEKTLVTKLFGSEIDCFDYSF
jgi:hypothetical protein